MNKVCIYLRKSRADEEAEKQGELDTLAKHRKALMKFAKEKSLNIINIKEEIVSGESIFHRPQMIDLLKEVELKLYDGVLVMDMQRLGRGDMQDQGIILKTFKESNTKIITPQKTYDLSNEFDEEYGEFEAFMSRKELKMINRRLQGGRIRSVEEGNYIGTNPPMGYDIDFVNRCRTLKPNDKADIVRMIFDMYVNQNMGTNMIAEKLTNLGYKSYTGKKFDRTVIANMIKNPIYIGKITWKKKESKKSKTEGKRRDTKTRDKSEWIIVEGKHESIVSEDIFNKANDMLKNKYHVPYQIVNGPSNPLAGIIICKVCGNKMKLRPYKNQKPHLICEKKCGNRSTRFEYVEKALLDELESQFDEYTITSIKKDKQVIMKNYIKQIEVLKKELETLKQQKLKLYDLLEQGVYNTSVFLERSNIIAERSNEVSSTISNLYKIIEDESLDIDIGASLKHIKSAIQLYNSTDDISKKNAVMKDVLEKVEYFKSKDQRNDNFTLIVTPRLKPYKHI